jgi:formate dehydrogenase major subunit
VVTGDSANDLLSLALDSNVHIGEYKAATCDIRPGRRPRGPALVEFVEGYRRRVRSERVEEFAERLDENGGGGS